MVQRPMLGSVCPLLQRSLLWLSRGLLLAMWLYGPHSARAEAPDARVGIGPSARALRGLDYVGVPWVQPETVFALGVGYGFTGAFGPASSDSHRLSGQAAWSIALNQHLALAAELAGRFDMHQAEASESLTSNHYISASGEPRISARVGFPLGEDLQLGGDLRLFFPGATAPSLDPNATSVDLVGQVAMLQLRPVSLLLLAGFRVDRSREVAPDRSRLRVGNRIGLGLSASNQVLMGLGVHYAVSSAFQTFVEWSYDLLIAEASARESPMRLSLGGRWAATSALSLELLGRASLSTRPDLSPEGPLVPIEPRAQLLLGLRYALAYSQPVIKRPDAPRPRPQAPPPPPQPTAGPLWGTIIDGHGKPVADARVQLQEQQAGTTWHTTTDSQGAFAFERVPFGPTSMVAEAAGFEPLVWTADHQPEGGTVEPLVMVPQQPEGQLRGLIRSWSSDPLAAEVEVENRAGEAIATVTASAAGELELNLPPGVYFVRISAPEHRSQKRRVDIRNRGVTILNVDLRRQRRRR